MKKALAILFTVILVAGMALVGSGCTTSNDPKNMKVGFIYIGPVGDMGFTWAQDQGRQYLENTLHVTTYGVESVAEDNKADFDSQVENLIKNKGCKVIFATSFGYGPYVDELAKKYPNVIFQHCSGDYKNDTNFGNYFGKIEQPRYLAGIAAGKATKTNKIGYVAAFPIPECIRGIDAFTLGVRSVNPDATVTVTWTRNWYDPTIEKQAAEGLIAAGCDVTAQHQDSPSAVAAAEAAGKFSTGYNSPMLASAPNGYLTSPVWNWGPYFVDVVKSVMDGTFKPQAYWGGIETGIVGIDTNYGPSVTQETKDLINTAIADMKAGKLNVFTGPIKAQDGTELVADGQTMPDADVWVLSKFVEGVIGEPK
jgi:basic membrane protein A